MGYWTVPRCFEGGTVAVLASGPSLTREQVDAVRDAGIPAIVINSTFRLAPWAWMLYAADTEWWLHPDNRAALQFAGLRVCCQAVQAPGVLRLKHTGKMGFDPDPGAVRTGGNSGYQALHIAVHAGAARVLLLGMDMTARDGCHWHGPHPAGLKVTLPETYDSWRRNFAELAPLLAERGVDVVNCTPGSALECFRRGELAEELEAVPCLAR